MRCCNIGTKAHKVYKQKCKLPVRQIVDNRFPDNRNFTEHRKTILSDDLKFVSLYSYWVIQNLH